MPAAFLLDLAQIDPNNLVVTREQIYERLPHRYEFMLLDGIVYLDRENMLAAAYHDLKVDDWWVRGHIPGRPLFPGVLMVETGAQLASYFARELLPGDKFIGFGGIDGVKFRTAVSPPNRMFFILKGIEIRPRRVVCDLQGVVNGQLAYEGRITGMPV